MNNPGNTNERPEKFLSEGKVMKMLDYQNNSTNKNNKMESKESR